MTEFVINTNDIIHNYNEISKLTGALVIPVLKADCYGLGAKYVCRLLSDCCGVSMFAVSRLEEALRLANIPADILVLSCYHDDASLQKAVDAGLTVSVDSLGQAKRIAAYAEQKGVTAKVQIKIDTGFGRFGFMPENFSDIKAVYSLDGINVRGIFSHFSASFDKSTKSMDRQLEKFLSVTERLKDNGIQPGIRHISNSCAVLRGGKYHLDAVRTGSALLGRLPMNTDADLKKVGFLQARIIDIRNLKKGSNIGYGNVYRLKRDTRVAVIDAGSHDGLLIGKKYDTFRLIDIMRYGYGVFKMLFSDNRLCVTVNGKKARTVGRVALTHAMIDVTGIDCKCADKVIIDISPLNVPADIERKYINV